MKYLIFALLLGSMVPFTAKADMIRDDHHVVKSCLEVDNIADYESDYVFYVAGSYKFPYAFEVENIICDLGGNGRLIAVRKDDVRDLTIDEQDSESAGAWPDYPANASLVQDSTLEFAFPTQAANTDTMVKQTYVVHVNKIDNIGVDVSLIRTFTEDENGSVTVVDAEDISAENSVEKNAMNTAAIAIGVVGLVGIALTAKKWKK